MAAGFRRRRRLGPDTGLVSIAGTALQNAVPT